MKTNNKKPNKILSREEIPQEYRWDVKSLYNTIDDWEKDCQQAEQLISILIKSKKTFIKSADSFLLCLQLKDKISKLIQKIYTYAHMRKDEDNRNDSYQSIYYKASSLLVKIEDSLSFIQPAILSLNYNTIKTWIKKCESLGLYQHYLENVYRKKEHILSPEKERIMAQAGEMAMVPENAFGILSNADLTFPSIKDKEGNSIPISQGNFVTLLRDRDRNFRKRVFKKYYQQYENHRNIFAVLLSGNLKKDRFFSYNRKYKNSLESALFEDNIPINVYKNLLEVVHKNIGLLHKYIQLKEDYLNLKGLHMYDMYVPLSEKVLHIDYLDAQDIVIEAFAPLGKTYQSTVKDGFKKRWIDVYENKGKTSGAYSTGSYRGKPFILLNYQKTIEDVYTLAHELGHSLHSYYTNRKQPFIYSDYPIFLAEIASTTNEALLTYYLLDKAEDKEGELVILNHFLEQFRTTMFRQTMFAEYEKIIHEYEEKGGSLTADWFSKQYIDLIRYYYGKSVVIDNEISLEWARIPHFYYHYYVYQYVTGFAAAIAFADKIIKSGEEAVRKYLRFLSSGSSDYPIDILKEAGIDMTTVNPLEESMELFSNLIDRLANLAKLAEIKNNKNKTCQDF